MVRHPGRGGWVAAVLAGMLAFPLFASNPVQLENAKPGSPDWKLTNEASGEIEGYASATSINRGESIRLYVNTTDSSYTINVYRMGWYGGVGARKVLGPIVRTGVHQPMPIPTSDGFLECRWSDPYTISVPNSGDPTDWASGVYLAKLTANNLGKDKYVVFVVRDDARPSNHYFQQSANTFAAYNNWGGKSLYSFNSTNGSARRVSFNRPYNTGAGTADFLWGWEYTMIRFLEREGYDLTYCTDVDTSVRGNLILNHRDFMVVGHDEYWSWAMRTNVENAINEGVNVQFLGGNICFWQIRYAASPSDNTPERTILSYKEQALAEDPYAVDSDATNDKYVTTKWRNAPVNRPESALIGVQYVYDPVNADIVVTNANHWVFANTGLTNGSSLPGLLGYEVDAMTADSPAGLVQLGHSPYSDNGNTTEFRQPSDSVIPVEPGATESPDAAARTGYSDMTIYTGPRGSNVFATGSIQFAWGLDDYLKYSTGNRVSPAAQQMMRNLMQHFAGTGAAADCVYSISPASATPTSAAGSATVALTASSSSCPWSATSNASWLTIASATSGSGSATITYAWTKNDGATRTGTLTIGDQTFTVTQAGCAFSLSATSASVPASGGAGSVNVTSSGCAWTASSPVSWVTITSGASGTANGTVQYNVAPNGGPSRTTTLTIATKSFTVTQTGGCSFSASANGANATAAGGTGSFVVTASDQACPWQATSTAPWLTLTSPASGTGSTTVTYSVAANPGDVRSGSIEVGGLTFTVQQANGCVYQVAPTDTTVPRSGGSVTINITTDTTCYWTASSNASWLTITSANNGHGNGSVTFQAPANSGSARSSVAAVAAAAVTIRQPAATVAAGDFDGNGSSDVLWRNGTSAANAIWLMNRTTHTTTVNIDGLPGTQYRFEGTADFNGDGQTDILIRNYATGANAVWLMNGTNVTSIVNLAGLPNTDYHIGGTGDFNGDGKPDILWRNSTTGLNAVWLMNGTTMDSVVNLPSLPNADFQLVGAGDFNGDGKPDIVWRNNVSGVDAIWIMNGTTYVSTVNIGSLPNGSYRIAAIADFDGDGQTDILWHNVTNGANAIWKMNGTSSTYTIINLEPVPNTQYEIGGPR
jgi:hypothetical protein